jgi:hypothetical protein
MTYDELVTNIRGYTDVDANVFTAPVIQSFITMAENRILRDIDLDVNKLEVVGNLTAGNKFLATPTDILTHRYMMITKDGEQIFLEFKDTSFMKEYWPDGSATGTPRFYSVWDEDTFYIAPTPDQNYVVELGYIRKPLTLSPSNPQTWVSTRAPEALLYACLIQAYSYTKGPTELMAYFENSYTQAVQGLGIEQQGRRRRDEYRDGMPRLVIKSPSPGPGPQT